MKMSASGMPAMSEIRVTTFAASSWPICSALKDMRKAALPINEARNEEEPP
jgi:hypothetical protein